MRAFLLLVALAGCSSGPRQTAPSEDAAVDPDVAVEKQLHETIVPAAFANVSLTELVHEVARGMAVHGTGAWSDAVRIPSCGAPGWTAYQVLHDANTRSGSFGWAIEDDGIRVYPATSGRSLSILDGLRVVSILPDKKTVQMVDAHGKVLWTTNVIDTCGPPGVGEPVIRFVSLPEPGILSVIYGMHSFATIDVDTGAATFVGSD